jgi:hypothetical protein
MGARGAPVADRIDPRGGEYEADKPAGAFFFLKRRGYGLLPGCADGRCAYVTMFEGRNFDVRLDWYEEVCKGTIVED